MSDALKFELVSPERLLMSAEVGHVVVPGTEGDFGVLPGHAPTLSTLRPGILEILDEGKGDSKRIYVRGGLADAGPESLTILAQQAVEVDELDTATIDKEIADIRTELENSKDEVAQASIAASLAQLETLKSDLGL